MRHVGYAVLACFALGCGPDPNAHLPRDFVPDSTGGIQSGSGGAGTGGVGSGGVSETGGTGGSGGTTTPRPTGGTAGSTKSSGGTSGTTSSGGATGVPTGGTVGSGGVVGGRGGGPGGRTSIGSGGVGSGGTTSRPGSGGATTSSSGELSSYAFPAGDEPCTPTKDISGGQSGSLGTGAICIRTADEITEWSCSGADDRTIKINAVATKCAGTPPAKMGSFYYFDFSSGANSWASISWWCSKCGGPGTHPVPACGHYPAWQSGQTVAPCVDAPPTSADAGASTADIDSGS